MLASELSCLQRQLPCSTGAPRWESSCQGLQHKRTGWRCSKQSRCKRFRSSGIENMPNTFSYAELRNATGDFSPTHKLGEGGFGPVYKGVMSDGKEIAVKKLLVVSIISPRKESVCSKQLLVYEYLKNTSLEQALFGKDALHLDWEYLFYALKHHQ